MPSTQLQQDVHERAERLLADVHGDRAELQRRQVLLQRRLRFRSADFEATDELRVVEAALRLAERPVTLGSRWHEREVR
ncbi:MAG TPA: hypothetical protein VFK42_14100 [Acidimicrobiales bacterium]|nr:hypothetical protein [Acidimicrobiales bacterium]